MLTPAMQQALNQTINAELYSANLYLALSGWCDTKALRGFGRWLRAQYHEELAHAEKLVDYVLLRGGSLAVGALEAPSVSADTILGVFEAVQAHERKISLHIDALYGKAQSEKDMAAQVFLQWFVTEQVEEEANAADIVEKLKLVGERPGSALYLDKEYGKRGKA